jgi:hypothetical protein
MSVLIRDLIHFQEVEEVIKLHDEREDIVRTYVISDSLRDSLSYMLELLSGATHKSFNVIGNYGTGKSHFLSFVAAILEQPDKRAEINDETVRQAALALQRPYIVIKFELGATQVPLRHVFFDQVQQQLLHKYDIEIEPVDLDRNYDNVAKMQEIIAAVKRQNPEAGLLVIIDEISDSLKQKPPDVMSYDLNFLRELGQISQSHDFVLIGAMQEHVFTNPKYLQEAANIARVAQRFVDITITKEDVTRVLSERVLRKTADQRLQLQGLLGDHRIYFTNLAERLERYVDVFPIHPYVIEVFEQLPYFENRGIIGFAMSNVKPILDQPAPSFVTYDRVFDLIDATHEIRNQPTVRPVVNVVQTLSAKIDVLPERYRDDAARIVKGLAVLKLLEHGAINGATAQELANTLFIIPPGKLMVDADLARDNVERILKNIREATKGQFIAYDGNFFYLDLEKTTDYDAEVDARIAAWGDSSGYVSRAFRAIAEAELAVNSQKALEPGRSVYADAAPWPHCHSYREGVLVIGDPLSGDRFRQGDFRFVLVGPVASPAAQMRQDELRLRLPFDDTLIHLLRRQAAAAELAAENSKERRTAFDKLAKEAAAQFRQAYLAELLQAGEAEVGGSVTPLTDLHTTRPLNVLADVVDFVKGELLGPLFTDKYPNYPRFRTRITAANIEAEMGRAVAALEKATLYGMDANSRGYLESLGASGKEGQFSSRDSAAAQLILQRVAANDKSGKVTPLDDILRELAAAPWGLQPPLVKFLLAALHANGEMVLVLAGGKRVHAGASESNLKGGLTLFDNVRYLERDRDIDVERVGRLFASLGLVKGLVVDKEQRAEAVKQLREKGLALFSMMQTVEDGFARARVEPLTDIPWVGLERLHTDLKGAFRQQVEQWRSASKVTDLGKLPVNDADLTLAETGLATLAQLHAFLADYHEIIKPGVTYMQAAADHFAQLQPYAAPAEQQTLTDLARIVADGRDILTSQKALLADDRRRPLRGKVEQFQTLYRPLYFNIHQRVVGKQAAWDKLEALRGDGRYHSLNRLKSLPFFSSAELNQIGLEMSALQRQQCVNFNAETLEHDPICPYCQFPRAEVKDVTAEGGRFAAELDKLWQKWAEQTVQETTRLLQEQVGGQSRANLIDPAERDALQALARAQALPETVSDRLVEALHHLAADIEAVTFDLDAFAARLLAEKSVLTARELEQAWQQFWGDLLRGHNKEQVRIQIAFGDKE